MPPSWQTQESRVYRTPQSLGMLSFGGGFLGEVSATPLVFGLLSATSVHFLVGTPNRLLWSDKFGPFLLRCSIPVSPGFLAGPLYLYHSLMLWEMPAAGRLHTVGAPGWDAASGRRPGLDGLVGLFLNRVGRFLNPCGNLVHVSCPDSLASGSFHSKANSGRRWGLSLKQKKASFRYNIVYQVWEGGKVLSRLYGLGTVGWMSSTCLFISLRSCTGL